jgi:nitrite reductase (NADH) small subunit
MSWVSLCQLDELKEDEGRFVQIDGFQLAVFLHEGHVYAVDNTCPHAGGSLSGGYIENGCVVCPWHHWAYRLESGELSDRPLVKIRTYETRLLEREGRATLVQANLPMY